MRDTRTRQSQIELAGRELLVKSGRRYKIVGYCLINFENWRVALRYRQFLLGSVVLRMP